MNIRKRNPRFFPTRGEAFSLEKGFPFLYRGRLCQTGYNIGIIKIVIVDLSMWGEIGGRGCIFDIFYTFLSP